MASAPRNKQNDPWYGQLWESVQGGRPGPAAAATPAANPQTGSDEHEHDEPAREPPPTEADLDAVQAQLGRVPRGVAAVAHRCPCGQPDVLKTEPRLPDGTPFPTTFYATCPKLTGAI